MPKLAYSQTSLKSGNIRSCDTWNFGSSTELNNASISNSNTIETNTTTTNLNSITFAGSNSVLQLNGSESLQLGTSTTVACTGSTVSNDGTISSSYLFNPTSFYCGSYTNQIPAAPATGSSIIVQVSFNNLPTSHITNSCYGNAGCNTYYAEVSLNDILGGTYGTQTVTGMCGSTRTVTFTVPFSTLNKTRYRVCHRMRLDACSGSFSPGLWNGVTISITAKPDIF